MGRSLIVLADGEDRDDSQQRQVAERGNQEHRWDADRGEEIPARAGPAMRDTLISQGVEGHDTLEMLTQQATPWRSICDPTKMNAEARPAMTLKMVSHVTSAPRRCSSRWRARAHPRIARRGRQQASLATRRAPARGRRSGWNGEREAERGGNDRDGEGGSGLLVGDGNRC